MKDILREDYTELHKSSSTFLGVSFKIEYINIIKVLVESTKTKTILDFGCGKAEQYNKYRFHRKLHIEDKNLHLYDIGLEKYNKLPSHKVDGTISTDVLEHIPEEEIDGVLRMIFKNTKKWVFFSISCGLAVRLLPNGNNAHCTIKEPKWWEDKIRKHNNENIPVYCKYIIPMRNELNILNLTKEDLPYGH